MSYGDVPDIKLLVREEVLRFQHRIRVTSETEQTKPKSNSPSHCKSRIYTHSDKKKKEYIHIKNNNNNNFKQDGTFYFLYNKKEEKKRTLIGTTKVYQTKRKHRNLSWYW